MLNDENVFNEIPEDRYPFNPTANGHEWKKWDEGDTSSQRIKEMNVFDHGQGLAAINLGEHAITDADGNGIPFKCRDAESEDGANPCPEKNVFDSLVDPELSKVRTICHPRVCVCMHARARTQMHTHTHTHTHTWMPVAQPHGIALSCARMAMCKALPALSLMLPCRPSHAAHAAVSALSCCHVGSLMLLMLPCRPANANSSPSIQRKGATSGARQSRRCPKTKTCLIRRSFRTTSRCQQ